MDTVKSAVRAVMRRLAKALHNASNGHLTPNHITLVGLAAHIPIAYLVAQDYLLVAGLLLIIFGLTDTLDGELARLQKSASASGMFLDSVTDRIKEVMLYVGVSWWAIYFTDTPVLSVMALAAAGISVLISYLNAWGEAVLSSQTTKSHAVNQTFRGGVLGFEVRMFLLVIALVFDYLGAILYVIIALGLATLAVRFASIMRRLSSV